MKQKVFGYSFIFLVIFQLFSPWMMNFSKTGITLNTNIAQAADYPIIYSQYNKIERNGSEYDFEIELVVPLSGGDATKGEDFLMVGNVFWDNSTKEPQIDPVKDTKLLKCEVAGEYTESGNLYISTGYIKGLSTAKRVTCSGSITADKTKNQKMSLVWWGVGKINGEFTKKNITGNSIYSKTIKIGGGFTDIDSGTKEVLWPARIAILGASKTSDSSKVTYEVGGESTSVFHKNDYGIKQEIFISESNGSYTKINTSETENDSNVSTEFGTNITEKEIISKGTFSVNSGNNIKLKQTITSSKQKYDDLLIKLGNSFEIGPFKAGQDDLGSGSIVTSRLNKTGTGSGKDDWFEKFDGISLSSSDVTIFEDSDLKKNRGTIKITISAPQSKPELFTDDLGVWNDNGTVPGEADGSDDFNIWNMVYSNDNINGLDLDEVKLTTFGAWASNFNTDKSVKDLTPDSGDDFEGFIIDVSTPGTDEFKSSTTSSSGINEFILDKTSDGKPAPIINRNKITFVSEFDVNGGIKPNTEYKIRIRVKLDNGDEYISIPVIFNSGDQATINQTLRPQTGFIEAESSGDVLNGENDPSWLPACDGKDAATWFQGCMVVGFYYLIFVPTSALLAFAGYMLDKVLVYSISPDAYKAQYIVDGWRFIRDLCNLFFIFMLIYLAFKVILGIGHGTKQLIVNTLIIATVINFSYPLATIVIDISNITARQLYYNAFNQKDADSGEPIGLSATATSGYNPQRLIVDSMQTNGLDKEKEKGSIFIILLIGVVFNIIAMFMFLRIAMQFIFRILGLVFAIILSPLAVFSYSLDETMRGKLKMVGFDQWLSGLLTDCFKAPVFLFLVLVMTLFINDNPFKSALVPGDVNNLEWWMSLIIPFALIMGFLMIIESATKNMSSGLSNMASEKFMATVGKAGSFAIGGAAGLVTGGAATLGRSTIGKWAAKSAENIRNSGKDNWINRQRLKALDKTAKASFDVRQTAVGSTITKQTGINLDNSWVGKIPGMSTAETAGGYMAMKDRAKKKEIDRAELLGHDKKLEENLNHEKENKEAEVKDIEKDDEINRSLLKELSQQLKENTEALESQEKAITAKYDDDIRDQDDQVKISDGRIAQLTAKLASATTAEKAGIQNDINTETGNRSAAISEKTRLQKEKVEKIKDLKENSTVGQNVTKIKADIKTAKETEADLAKKKNEAKFGVEIEVVKKDSHGHVVYEKDSAGNIVIDATTGEPKPQMVKVRSGGIAGIDKAISRVKNNKMLEATLRHKRKSTGDAIELKSYLQKYTEDFNGDKAKAMAQLEKEFGKDNVEKISKTNYAGSAGKPGHMHEVTHMINDHFHPEQHKSNYKPPAGGGGAKPPSNDHGHDAGHGDAGHH